jgi:hypothetical protein
MALTELELETILPSIDWRAPLPVTTQSASGLGCRYCIAMRGLKGSVVGELPQTDEEFERHMRDVHGRAAILEKRHADC